MRRCKGEAGIFSQRNKRQWPCYLLAGKYFHCEGGQTREQGFRDVVGFPFLEMSETWLALLWAGLWPRDLQNSLPNLILWQIRTEATMLLQSAPAFLLCELLFQTEIQKFQKLIIWTEGASTVSLSPLRGPIVMLIISMLAPWFHVQKGSLFLWGVSVWVRTCW